MLQHRDVQKINVKINQEELELSRLGHDFNIHIEANKKTLGHNCIKIAIIVKARCNQLSRSEQTPVAAQARSPGKRPSVDHVPGSDVFSCGIIVLRICTWPVLSSSATTVVASPGSATAATPSTNAPSSACNVGIVIGVNHQIWLKATVKVCFAKRIDL